MTSPLLDPSRASTPSSGAEADLREEVARLRRLLEATAQVTWSTDPARDALTPASPSWTAFTGQTPEQLRDHGWLLALHPDDRAGALAAWERARAGARLFSTRYRLRRVDGTYVWMLARGVPVLGPDGAVREWVGTCIDIQAQVLGEQRATFLARASELFASSLDASATMASLANLSVSALADWCIVDMLHPDGHFERVQVVAADPSHAPLAASVQRLTPVPRERPVYPPAVALATGQSTLVSEVTDAVIESVAQDAEHLETMRRVGIHSLLTVPLMARGHILGALTFLVTTPSRRYGDEDLRFAQELANLAALAVDNARLLHGAREAIRLRDEFLSVASHELKTPLTPLSLKLQALSRAVKSYPDSPLVPVIEAHVETGHRQVRRLTELMNDLLDVSRISAGTFRLQREEVDVAEVVREVAALFAPRFALEHCEFQVEAPESVRGCFDRARLAQVLDHLLDNALKYGAGTPVSVRLVVDGPVARLTVRDGGIGISPEQRPRLFERYGRAVSERHYGGLGLGLYLTRTIVEAEGGSVSLDSQLGEGAMITVELPLTRL
ncbi:MULTISPECIES: sensor histidine kinase [unclassified Corallococcus]|uniref:sensor histidine kinase n=1 Tax=unclassified Corallococcus TaxID=2685029 RepID=UPI001A8D4D5A|nr:MULTISPECIES: ATP-binding protein [unclassified Corallococcus]MBN9684584.1 PAS domain-containing protein [Corallococcus sp. NCSPR001]WAS83944.1 ATP-binding protein [Corallococcus sp. NCRR]